LVPIQLIKKKLTYNEKLDNASKQIEQYHAKLNERGIKSSNGIRLSSKVHELLQERKNKQTLLKEKEEKQKTITTTS